MYGKLFAQMYDGTLAGNWKALVTFQQMIVLCDSAGVIDMTPEALARRTGIPLDVIQEGIAALEAPDPSSRTPDNEGRRIERLDAHRAWGWVLVNHKKYQQMVSHEEKRAADRERIATKRATQEMSQVVASCRVASHPVADVAHTDTDTDTNAVKKKNTSPAAPSDVSPNVWADFQAIRKAKKSPLTATGLAGIRREADKACITLDAALQICCERGWQSFKADWIPQTPEMVAAEVMRMLEAEGK